jgi:hypothetical protein
MDVWYSPSSAPSSAFTAQEIETLWIPTFASPHFQGETQKGKEGKKDEKWE